MKKISLLIKTFIVVTSLATVNMSAQLLGQYTINKNAPVSASNFTSFTDFATSINVLGVSGSVSVDVVANTGPYVEQVQFTSITGASATNSIAINGNGNLLDYALSSSNMPWVMNLDGADYFRISNLNLRGTSSYAYVLVLSGDADYNGFTNCEFENSVVFTFDQVPIVISGSNQYAYIASNSANSTTFTSCTTKNGYASVVMNGNIGYANNSFIDCKFLDAVNRGLHCFVHTGLVIKGCVIDRANRAPYSGQWDYTGLYIESCAGSLIEGNWIRNIKETDPFSNLTIIGINVKDNGAGAGVLTENVLQNNVISEINTIRGVTGIRLEEANAKCYHNSVVLDNLRDVGPSWSANNAFEITAWNYGSEVKNNLVYAKSSATVGTTDYGIQYSGTGLVSSNNLFRYSNATSTSGATLAFVDNGTTYNGLAAYQTASNEIGSTDLDPNFLNLVGGNYIPGSYNVNNMGTALSGVPLDYNGTARSPSAPDYGAFEFLNIPCVGAPVSNTVIGPTITLCPFEPANLGLVNSSVYGIYTGLSFQWQSSATSSLGPFTAVSGATNLALTTATTTQSKWYNVVITCTNGGNFSTSAVAAEVQIASTTTNTVPYFEGFEGINGSNKIPNCSWWVPNIGNGRVVTSTTTYPPNRFSRTGVGYAAFSDMTVGDDYFYTNGIYLNAGVTYSASLWYLTDLGAYNPTATKISIKVGMNQDTTGHVTIASTNGPLVTVGYKSLSNTFSVATSGLYYVSVVGANSGGSSFASQYLTWDDLAIEVPCSLNPNPISIGATPGATVCRDQTVTLTASGNGNFQWSNGATTPSINVIPSGNATYVVTLTNSATGCSTSVSQNIVVNPKPVVSVFAPVTAICKGSSANINAFGALYYNWSNGGSVAVIVVTPTVNTTYTVTGKNQYGCEDVAVQTITVNNLPVVTAASVKDQICVGEMITLTASGAVSYTWTSQNNYVVGSPVAVSPQTTTTYSLTGTDVNGCNGSSSFAVSVAPCTGVAEISSAGGTIRVYPNPNDGAFVMEFNNDNKRIIEITDVTGRLVSTELASDKKLEVNISNLAAGVYYVKVKSDKASEVIRIIKN